jgi:hypothetical protein
MTLLLRKHWVAAVLAGTAALWFLLGENPVQALAAKLGIGRGRRLTMLTLDDQGNVLENIDDLTEAATEVMGRPVSKDALLLAIMSGSEHASASEKEKAAMQRVALNRITVSKDLESVLTGGKGLGEQTGRPFSTARDAWEDDLAIAEANLAGELEDETLGATRFVHKTGFASLGRYQEVCAKWYAEAGIVPIDIGGVSSLRLFIPEANAKELGYA